MKNVREQSLEAARRYKTAARYVYGPLSAYGNKVASLDEESRDFIIATWTELKPGVACVHVATQLQFFETCLEMDDFSEAEAKFILDANEFFGATRSAFFALRDHYKDNAERYKKWPDARARLKRIIRTIDGDLAKEEWRVKEVRRERLSRLEELKKALGDVENIPDIPEGYDTNFFATWLDKDRSAITRQFQALPPEWGSESISNESGRWRIEGKDAREDAIKFIKRLRDRGRNRPKKRRK